MKYSFIVPVYNRPDEVRELLATFVRQPSQDYELLLIEDGSTSPCKEIADAYHAQLPTLRYYAKENGGPGQARNYGAERATGEFLVFLDSDVLLPDGYIEALGRAIAQTPTVDAFGAPDRASDSFTPVQKAINYSMTSFFTTGGIRGGNKRMDKFYPRSYNMGVRRTIFVALGGFAAMRFGEDIDLSIRIFAGDHTCLLFPDAWVYHKRRTDFRKFFRQVYNSGIARINLYKKYPASLKPVHLLPAAFTLGIALLLLGAFFTLYSPLLLFLYVLLLWIDASWQTRDIRIGLISVAAAFVQLTGYGLGFLSAWWKRCVLGQDEFTAFGQTFYK